MRDILFYRTESGKCPVEEFINELDGKQARKVAWVMSLVEELDIVPAQYFRKMPGTNDLWEIRVQQGGNIFRFFGFLHGQRLVVLTHALEKKSQKTPQQDLEVAAARKQEYIKRSKSR